MGVPTMRSDLRGRFVAQDPGGLGPGHSDDAARPGEDIDEGIVGGEPSEVVVRISDLGIEIGVFRMEWTTTVAEVVIKDWKHLPFDSKPAAVSRAIQAARARRIRTYRWCTLCHEVNPPECIEGGRCYACQERNGVVF